jgi:hypothetical protein
MDLAFTVTPRLSKRFCSPDVLCHATNAAPLGPPSDTQDNPLAINFLPTFIAPPPKPVARIQNFVAAEHPNGGPNDVPERTRRANVNKT